DVVCVHAGSPLSVAETLFRLVRRGEGQSANGKGRTTRGEDKKFLRGYAKSFWLSAFHPCLSELPVVLSALRAEQPEQDSRTGMK
ncbi:hypothetical protein, partial [Pantoea ananatis]|uniref:hypothetical protein n=1 Tax=Pantoea ananas TaxID=553 RepID=UPI0023AF7B91